MASNQNTKSCWKCPKGCALSREPCPHLEKLLPGPRDAELPLADQEQLSKLTCMSPNVDDLIMSLYGRNMSSFTGTGEAALIKQMDRYGLSVTEKELILQHYVEGVSLSQLAKQHQYFDHKGVGRHITSILRKLQDSGFGAKKKRTKK